VINVVSHTIVGGELDQAGSASARLKEMLKKVGVQPNGMRRAVIAAYEAEMNVVIHARKGLMVICLNTDYVDVTVTDEGPGIVDIDQAMEEGFSTAPPAARELDSAQVWACPISRRTATGLPFTRLRVRGRNSALRSI